MRDLRNRLNDWLDDTTVEWLIIRPGQILLIFVIAIVVRWIIHRAIDKMVRGIAEDRTPALPGARRTAALLNELRPGAAERREQRAQAVGSLLKSIVSVVILGVATLMTLDLLGLPIGPLLASAGVLGLAIGFGAQALIKDFLAGVFMILEDQYGVGDVIDTGDVTGVVEAVGLRVTQLRDDFGTVWYVRNGEVLRIGNQSQNWANSNLDITVDYSADLEQVHGVLEEIADAIADDASLREIIVDRPEIRGIERFDPDGVVLRVAFTTAPTRQWQVARAIRHRVKTAFDRAGIKAAAAITTADG